MAEHKRLIEIIQPSEEMVFASQKQLENHMTSFFLEEKERLSKQKEVYNDTLQSLSSLLIEKETDREELLKKKVEEIRKTQQSVAFEVSEMDFLGFVDLKVIQFPPYPLTWRWNTYNLFNSEHNVSVDDNGNMSWNHNAYAPSSSMASAAGVGVFFTSNVNGMLYLASPAPRINYEYHTTSTSPILDVLSDGWIGYYIGAVSPRDQTVGSSYQPVWNSFYSSSSRTTRNVYMSPYGIRISKGVSYSLWNWCGGEVRSSMGFGGSSSADGSMSLNFGTIEYYVFGF
ncbi:hypothetical protein COF80_20275 [Bacillus toyonensis]|uniref:hypothetical protein n=1 Tax=Bacillus toyonensis TaxID=155322 RepID=UPI000BF14D08|nr:hypothetical protein [Bacillus toyonensis]PEK45594.1 hypothetical protein CN586_14995 [Bacillus toyonensis]PHE84249.1 hypothetical protein COF80_20275 [Bacillus toyonensis]